MAKRSTVEQLPEAVRHAFERKLVENGFADYAALAEWLQEQGYEISRSAAHRYGQKVQRRFAAIKNSTEAARLIAEGAADEGDTRSEALTAMLQTELFDALVQIGEMDNEELNALDRFDVMAEGAKKISGLISASTRLKEYQAKVKAKVAAAAEDVAKQAKKGGLSDEAAEAIRKQILGIAT
ncbi:MULTISPECIES: DUF3486 family protein [unclassified Neisseria]|uniref:DUF3486 family protein n=1 Tax=unclassified Neisseria TaxID=2623750 RepID=UPI0010724F54|nr:MULTISPECIES: phage protein Gp27 family protein [unclassified Neisseria]MBF0802943.1 DUF3486 family protein [Neisseria sp. 19428wB4_WF04]TFU44472.1 DUF3486 family protein [Neisseria sp. WF04]